MCKKLFSGLLICFCLSLQMMNVTKVSAQENLVLNALEKSLKEFNKNLDTAQFEEGIKDPNNWNRLLREAIRYHHKDRLLKLLEMGVDLNTLSPHENSVLFYVSYYKNMETLEILLKHGANTEARDHRGNTLLLYASQQGRYFNEYNDVIKLLLKYGANIEAQDEKHYTALLYAASKDNYLVVKTLLENGASVSYKTPEGDSAIDVTSDTGIMDLLVAHGAEYKDGVTPLMAACRIGDVDRVKTLLEKMEREKEDWDIESLDDNGFNALMHATFLHNAPVMGLLLEHGARVNARNELGFTALIYASRENKVYLPREEKLKTVRILLDHYASIDMRNTGGWSALMAAIAVNHLNIAEELLKRGANIETRNMKGETPLIIATLCNNVDSVAFLLEKGADVNAVNRLDESSLIYAARISNAELFALLLENGAEVNLKDVIGKTALMHASEEGVSKHIEVLLKRGAQVNDVAENGMTALDYAQKNEHVEVIEILLQYGAKSGL